MGFNSTRWISNPLTRLDVKIGYSKVSTPHGGLATMCMISNCNQSKIVSTPHGGLATENDMIDIIVNDKFQLHTVD